MPNSQVGKVIHYYDKINVAIVRLTKGDIKIGDTVRLVAKDGKQFDQQVESMQIEHASIDIAKEGDEFGLKVKHGVKANSQLIKV